LVERVVVQDFDVEEPFLEVVSRNQLDAWRQGIADLDARLSDKAHKTRGELSQTFWSSLPSLLAANCADIFSRDDVWEGRQLR
jgi:hypothetical protein